MRTKKEKQIFPYIWLSLVISFLLIQAFSIQYDPYYYDGSTRPGNEYILFEDDSFILGNIAGCLPFGMCQKE